MKKTPIFALIAVIIGVIIFSSFMISQNDGSDETEAVVENEEESVTQPQGRNLSIELEENMGFSAP